MEEALEALLDLEAKLRQDARGSYKKEITDQLSEYSVRMKGALDTGLPSDEFQAIRKLKDAVDAASTVVERVWAGIHG